MELIYQGYMYEALEAPPDNFELIKILSEFELWHNNAINEILNSKNC